MNIDVYKRYYEGDCLYSGVKRKGCVVTLTSRSGGGEIAYVLAVNFFPHTEPDDFAVSYDAYSELTLYSGRGRRSKKREAALLGSLQEKGNVAAETIGGKVFWERPLRDAVLG